MRNVLNMQLNQPSAALAKRLSASLQDGMRVLVPPSMRTRRWKATRAIHRCGTDDTSVEVIAVEQALLGDIRISSPGSATDELPIEIEIAREKVYFTTISLPAAAARNLRRAVTLRLGEISPVPVEAVDFDFRFAPSEGRDRILVDVAIVKNKTLDDVERRYGVASWDAIGADFDSDGRLRFVFRRNKNSAAKARHRRMARKTAFLGIATIALCAAADNHLTRRAAALDAYETALILELRSVRRSNELFAGANLNSSERASLPEAIAVVLNAAYGTPEKTIVEQAHYQRGRVSLKGFYPEAAAQWSPSNGRFAFSPSGYANFRQFDWVADGENKE